MRSQPPRETDVVVVGGGGAGLATAVTAAERGVGVVLVEKRDQLGGTTALSVGSITAAGTRLQRKAGVRDSAEAFAEDMIAFDPARLEGDAPTLRNVLSTEAAATVDWLESLGVAFSGPYPEPPHRVPRMHNVIPNSKAYIARLSKAATRRGVSLELGTGVIDLLVEDGTVCGVRVNRGGASDDIRARRAVVLATGDFSGNARLRKAHLPAAAAAANPVNPHARGDGHQLATALGARTLAMDVTFGPQLRFPEPPNGGLINRLPMWVWLCKAEAMLVRRLPVAALRPFVKSLLVTHMSPSMALFEEGAILVNRRGERFCDEEKSVDALSSQEGGRGYIVLDARVARTFNGPPNAISTAPGIAFAYFDDYRRGRPDLVHSADTASALAQRIEVDAEKLDKSIADRGLQPPFHVMGPVFSMLTVTEGGLAVDEQMRVLNQDEQPIDGLYAVGGVGQGGMLLLGHGHHIGWAMTSGRIAGAMAARRRPRSLSPDIPPGTGSR